MGKIRSKDTKPKIQKDFQKKTVKVGRQVKRNNITQEIKINTKRIIIPLQNQITTSEHSKIDTDNQHLMNILKQLKHYSMPNRLMAIKNLKDFLSQSHSNSSNHLNLTSSTHVSKLPMIMPDVMELLHDDEKEIRGAVVELFNVIFKLYKSESILSVVQVIVTYMCSGLTSIHKGIRKDSLIILQHMAELHGAILIPHLEKVLRHVNSILNESLQMTSTVGGNTKPQPNINGTNNIKNINMRAVTNNENKNDSRGSKNSNKPTLFILSIKVIKSLLQALNSYTQAHNQHSQQLSSYENNSLLGLQYEYNKSHNENCYLFLRAKSNTNVILSKTTTISNNSNISLTENILLSSTLSLPLLVSICKRISSMWAELSMQKSNLPLETINIFNDMTMVALSIGQLYKLNPFISDKLAYLELVDEMFHLFPYSCFESSIAVPNSTTDINGRLISESLNICLVEIIFVATSSLNISTNSIDYSHFSDDDINPHNSTEEINIAETVASNYLLDILSYHINQIQFQQKTNIIISHDQEARTQVQMTQSSNDTIMKLAENQNEQFVREMDRDIINKIFHTFKICMCSYSYKTLIQFVTLLKDLIHKMVQCDDDSIIKSSKYIVIPCIICLCDIATTQRDNYQESQQLDELLIDIFSALPNHLLYKITSQKQRTIVLPLVIKSILQLFTRFNYDDNQASMSIISSYNRLINSYKLFFNDKKLYAISNVDSIQQQTISFYHELSVNERLNLIYCFAYIQTENIIDIIKLISHCISHSSTSHNEQETFLSLLYERRMDLSESGLMTILMNMMNNFLYSHDLSTGSETIEMMTHENHFVSKMEIFSNMMADFIRLCVNSQQPHQLSGIAYIIIKNIHLNVQGESWPIKYCKAVSYLKILHHLLLELMHFQHSIEDNNSYDNNNNNNNNLTADYNSFVAVTIDNIGNNFYDLLQQNRNDLELNFELNIIPCAMIISDSLGASVSQICSEIINHC
eukprot:gene8965-12093_t